MYFMAKRYGFRTFIYNDIYMEKLPLEYTKNSYNFKQVRREGDVCMYEQYEPSNNRLIGYEVFVVLTQEEGREFRGSALVAKELTPGKESWGYLGFSPFTLEAANKRFDELLQRQAAKIAAE